MAEDLGVPIGRIQYLCDILKCPAITLSEQQKGFILAHKHWCREQLSKSLEVGDARIRELCDELDLNIPLKPEPKGVRTLSDQLRETWR